MPSLRMLARSLRGTRDASPSRPSPFRSSPRRILAVAGMALLVSPLTPLSPLTPTLAMTPGSAAAGVRVLVAGTNFTQRTRVQLTWDGSAGGMPILAVNRDGQFSATMVVPNTKLGPHTLGAVRVQNKGQTLKTETPPTVVVLATEVFTITTDEPSPDPSTDPTIGPDPTPGATFTPDPTAAPLPTAAPDPTAEPTAEPTATAAPDPTAEPTQEPTVDPTAKPTPNPTPKPTPKPTPNPTPPPSGGVPAMPSADLLRKDFSDDKLWPFRIVDYPNDHPTDPMSWACDYKTDSSVISVHDGYLHLRAYPKAGGRWNCGFVSTGMDGNGNGASFSVKYGYVQFAAKMNVGHATWQAPIWLLNTVTGWHAAEIDVAEVIRGRLTYNLHGTVEKQVASVSVPSNLASSWHVFGVAKTSSHITFVMDGKVIGRWNGSMTDPMALLADSKVGFKWDDIYPNGTTPDPTWVKLAWVTVSSHIPSGL